MRPSERIPRLEPSNNRYRSTTEIFHFVGIGIILSLKAEEVHPEKYKKLRRSINRAVDEPVSWRLLTPGQVGQSDLTWGGFSGFLKFEEYENAFLIQPLFVCILNTYHDRNSNQSSICVTNRSDVRHLREKIGRQDLEFNRRAS
jgi:hypothetical protein